MKTILLTAVSALLLAFGGCATNVSPEDYAAAKERRAQRASVCAQSTVFKCEAVAPADVAQAGR